MERVPYLPVVIPQRPYVGLKDGKREVFTSAETPTKQSHPQFNAVIGPFRTKKAAEFTVECGGNNPHIQCVNDAERLVKEQL